MAAKVADQLIEVIGKAGIKRIYAVTGDRLNEVNDAVRRTKTKSKSIFFNNAAR